MSSVNNIKTYINKTNYFFVNYRKSLNQSNGNCFCDENNTQGDYNIWNIFRITILVHQGCIEI